MPPSAAAWRFPSLRSMVFLIECATGLRLVVLSGGLLYQECNLRSQGEEETPGSRAGRAEVGGSAVLLRADLAAASGK